MKFRIGLAIFTVFAVIVGVAVFLFLPKGGIRNGIFFKTYEGVYAKITGSVTGGANDIELNDLVYGDGSAPTGQELSSWQVNLDFGDGDEITVTIRVENQSADSLYLFFQDNGSEINNVTKAIYNNGRPYQSGRIIFIGASGAVDDETILTIVFRKEQDVTTNIRYKYELKLTGDPTVEEGLVTTTDLIFEYDQTNNTAIVTGISASSTDSAITIPAKVIKDGTAYTVKGIGDCAFENKTNIVSVIFPYSLTSIGNSAFFGCTNLRDVEIPPTVLTIGNKAFQKCTSLETIVIPDSVTSIGKNIFTQCTALTNVEIGRNLTNLASYAFSKCSALQQITIPQTVTSFGTYLFLDCINLTTVNIPSRVTELPDRVFSGCKKLQLSAIPEGITKMGNSALYDCDKITNLTLPTSLTEVSSNTFAGLGNLENLIVPCSFTLTQNSPFSNINVMPDITVFATTDCSIMGDIFCSSNISTITLREGITEILEYAFHYCHFLTEISIPASVTSIGNAAFNECNNLTKVVTPSIEDWLNISFSNEFSNPLFYAHNLYTTDGVNETLITNLVVPSTITTINNYSLYGCENITSVTISASVTSIGAHAFGGCVGLTKVVTPRIEDWLKITFDNYSANPLSNAHNLYVINGSSEILVTNIYVPSTVTAINNYSLYGCSSITSVTIPASVASIGTSAFQGCSGLIKVVTPRIEDWLQISFENYYANPLSNAHNLYVIDGLSETLVTNIYVPNTVTAIKDYAFRGCSSITSVTISNGVSSIGNSAFSDCGCLTGVTIPSSVTSMGNYAFSGCTSLTSVNIGSGVTSIGDSAFSGCSGVVTMVIPASVSSIGRYSFSGCSGLTNITFEDNSQLETIKEYTFNNCSALKRIIIPASVRTIEKNAFKSCSRLESIYIPSSVLTISATWYYDSPFYYCLSILTIYTDVENSNNKPNGWSTCWNRYSSSSSVLTVVWNTSSEDYLTMVSLKQNNPDFKFNGTKIIGYNGNSENIVIPDGVTGIAATTETFQNKTFIQSVQFPSTITSVDANAFNGCTGLNRVVVLRLEDWFKISFGNSSANPLKLASNLYLLNGGEQEQVTSLVIPSTVTVINYYALCGYSSLTSITIPNTVNTIGKMAFAYCTGLSSIYIPSTVTTISASSGSDSPFYKCLGGLTIYTDVESSNNMPNGWATNWNKYESTTTTTNNSLTVIWNTSLEDYYSLLAFAQSNPDFAFQGTKVVGYNGNSENVIVPEGVTAIAGTEATFRGKTFIQSIQLPSTLVSLDNYAFRGCSGLTEITIPAGVNSIGENAFSQCTNLNSINFSSESELKSINYALFSGCSSLKNVVIPSKVTSIGKIAFNNCVSLKYVFVPKSVNYISTANLSPSLVYPFLHCSDELVIFTEAGADTTNWSRSWHYRDQNVGSIVVSVNNVEDCYTDIATGLVLQENNPEFTYTGTALVGYSGTGSSVVIPENTKIIQATTSVFKGKTTIQTIKFPSSILSIATDAFSGCSNINKVIIPNIESWLKISFGSYTSNPLYFAHSLYINDGVNEVLAENLTITNSQENPITFIRSYALWGCTSIISIIIPKEITTISFSAFRDCSNLTSVTFEENSTLEIIRSYAFTNCFKLTTITIPDTVTQIDQDVFQNCRLLESITLPVGITKIPLGLFDGCNKLNNVTILGDVTEIGSDAFSACGFTSFTVPNSVKSIGSNAFRSCSGLSYISIPNGLESLAENVFENCNSLLGNEYGGAMYLGNATNNYVVLYKVPDKNITQLTIHDDCKFIYQSAARGCKFIISITIPENIVSIGNSAFFECYGLTEIYNKSSLEITKGSTNNGWVAYYAEAVYSGDELDNPSKVFIDNVSGITYYKESEESYVAIALIDKTKTDLVLDIKTTKIKSYAFYNCSSITTVVNLEGVTSIGENAFSGCSKLISVIIPGGVTTINASVFKGCSGLTNVTIPNGVTSIKNFAFSGCVGLTSITIPSSVISMGTAGAFENCTNLTTVTVDSADVYNTATNTSNAGYLLNKATTVNVLASVVDGDGNTNSFLNDTTKFTKSENAVKISEDNENLYYVYTKVQ